MLDKLVFKELEDGTKLVSYSPRRLAKSYYCGVSGYHDRYSPGAPTTGGMIYGLGIDRAISELVSNKTGNASSNDIEFYVFNTPQVDENTLTAVPLSMEFDIPDTNYRIVLAGHCDVLYSGRVVEVKTGKAKAWHKIQALAYACMTGKPCQIIYVTRGYSIVIEPDFDELLRITEVSLDKEISRVAEKCEHCEFCGLKPMCSEFNMENIYIKSLCVIRDLVKYSSTYQEAKMNKDILKLLIAEAHKHLKPGQTYVYGGYTITTRSTNELEPYKVNSLTFRKKKYFN
jgi:hypothetical protein